MKILRVWRWRGAAAMATVALMLTACAHVHDHGRDTRPMTNAPSAPESDSARLPLSPAVKFFQPLETIAHRSSTEFVLTNAGWLLKVEIIPDLEPESAKALVEESILSVEALYANALAPYPGDISKQIVSNRAYRPQLKRVKVEEQERAYFLLYATERFNYGASTADTLRYRSLLGWFVCPRSGAFYKVRGYAPLTTKFEELEGLFVAMRCPD